MKDHTKIIEAGAVVLTGLMKFIFVDLIQLKLPFIIASVAFWTFYIIQRGIKNPGLFSYWGFTRKNIVTAFLWVSGLLIPVIAALIVYGIFMERYIFSSGLLFALIFYPLWGLIQQFLTMSLVAGNLNDLKRKNIPVWLTMLITSVVFSAVHYPSLHLMIGTFFLALVYSWLYLRLRNLWGLAIYHGWTGAVFYYFVLGRDVWAELALNTF